MDKRAVAEADRRAFLAERGFDVVAHFDRIADADADGLDGQVADGDDLLVLFCALERDEIEGAGKLHGKYPQARFVLLDAAFEIDTVIDAFRNGFDGCIIDSGASDLVAASLQLVALGQKVMPTEVAEILFDRHGDRPDEHVRLEDARLSERELEVVAYLVRGATNKVISRSLNIAESTVKVHVKAVLRKLHLHNRTQAAIWGIATGVGHRDGAAGDVRMQNLRHPLP